MEMEKDTRFWLTSFFDEQAQKLPEYNTLQRGIQKNGYFTFKTDFGQHVKVYTPELALIFITKKLPAENLDTKKKVLINGFIYLDSYLKAFNEGIKYFETDIAISSDNLYGVNAKNYVLKIHRNYFHINHNEMDKGWQFVKEKYPLILTHKVISKFGYYSGIVSKVDEMVKKHIEIFQTFDKCEHNPEHLETNTTKNRTRELIENEFENIKDKCFSSDNNTYEIFINLLTNYFEGKPYSIPENKIELKRGCKTKIATVFNPIHKDLIMSDKKLKADKEYFKIIRVLSHFSGETDTDIYKAITR